MRADVLAERVWLLRICRNFHSSICATLSPKFSLTIIWFQFEDMERELGLEYDSDEDDFGLGAAEKNMNFRADMDKESEDKFHQRTQSLAEKRVRDEFVRQRCFGYLCI